jgi:hypothetical protein
MWTSTVRRRTVLVGPVGVAGVGAGLVATTA